MTVLPCQSLNLSVCSTGYQHFWFPTFREKDKIIPSDPLKLVIGHVTCMGETKVIISDHVLYGWKLLKTGMHFTILLSLLHDWLYARWWKLHCPLNEYEATIWSRDFTSRYLSKKMKTLIWKCICIPVFMQHSLQYPSYRSNLSVHKCLLTDGERLINKWILLSHKKEWNLAFCSNMDGSGGAMLSEISQREKNEHCMVSLICGI